MSTSLSEIAQLGRAAVKYQLASVLTVAHSVVLSQIGGFVTALDAEMTNSKYNVLSPKLVGQWRDAVAGCGGDEGVCASVLLGTLLARAPARASSRRIPAELLESLCEQLYRIALELVAGTPLHTRLVDAVFLKELGICRLEVLPCKSLIVDKNSGVPRRLAFSGGIGQTLRVLRLIALTRVRLRPYFEIHAHTPMINHFNPPGWDHCYRLVAVLLRRYPEYRGLVGGSWFFDPEVSRISPHLEYLIRRPQAAGAVFFRVGTSQSDIDNATAKSRHRRKLYEDGKYVPTSYFMVWPREQLLEWAEHSTGEGLNRPVSAS